MRPIHRAFSVLFILFLAVNFASAAQLIWDTAGWTPGTLTNSFDVDSSSAGNDLTVTVAGATPQLQLSLVSPNPATPAITRAFDGGLSPGHAALELALNLTNNTQFVTVTMTFSNLYLTGVSNLSFTLFDIDFSNVGGNTYQDTISSITGTSATGATLTPTITGLGPNVSLDGSQVLTGMVSTADTGANSGLGNATITFNSPDIRSITFTYGSGSAFANPTYQHIGIYNLDYLVVPEPSSLSCALIGFGVMAGWIFLGRTRRFTKISV